jgi:alpha-tubulin suppressor-like RCC1 family protein
MDFLRRVIAPTCLSLTVVFLSLSAPTVSNATSVQTVSAPGPVTYLVAGVRNATAATNSSIGLSWNAPSSDGGAEITDYVIEYRKVGTLYWVRWTHDPSPLTSANVTGLSPASLYMFRVAASHGSDLGPWNVAGTGISMGSTHSCFVKGYGTLACAGANSNAELGDGTTTPSSTPVQSVSSLSGLNASSTAVDVAAGDDFSCALSEGHTVRCWGANSFGQLGNGTNVQSITGVSVSGIDGSSLSASAIAIAAGAHHACAVMADSSVKCWGAGAQGQLGNGAFLDSSSPVNVDFSGVSSFDGVVEVSAGANSTCVLFADGRANCWGDNSQGQLSFPSPSTLSRPGGMPPSLDASVTSSTVLDISIGETSACAVMADGTVQCWGSTYSGQLGDMTRRRGVSGPVSVAGLAGTSVDNTAVEVAVGASHACVLLARGTVECWGRGEEGQLGGGSSGGDRSVPVQVTGINGLNASSTAVQIIAGGDQTCAVMGDGTAKCWGKNSSGQLGIGSTINTEFPTLVHTFTTDSQPWNRITAGPYGSTTAATAPDAPTSVVASGATGNSIDVSWTAPGSDGGSLITNYVVQYRLASAESWSTFSHTPSPVPSVTVTDLATGSYVFQIAAVSDAGSSEYSDPSIALATLALVPTDVVATRIERNILNVSWTAAPRGLYGVSSYLLQKRRTSDSEAGWRTVEGLSTRTSRDVFGLLAGTSYIFRVAAVYRIGEAPGAWSAVSTPVSTQAVAPNEPTSVIASGATSNSINLSWTAPSSDGGSPITNYVVKYREFYAGSWSSDWLTFRHDMSAGTSITVTNLTSDSGYTFEIAAVNEVGTGSYSDSTHIVSTLAGAPGVPRNVRTSGATGSSLQVSWLAPIRDGGAPIRNYVVQYQLASSSSWSTVSRDASPATSVTVRGLDPASAYIFRVNAVNRVDSSDWSTPSEVAATSGTNTRRLTFLDSDGDAITGGAISWATLDGDFRSAADYGLTALGNVDLLRVPAGNVRVTVDSATLSSGAQVSGSWEIVSSGRGALTLQVPAEPSNVERVVRVTSGGTLPIVGASVTVTGLTQSTTRNGFRFFLPAVKSSGTTDVEGSFEARGFVANGDPVATVIYSDGILWQRQRNTVLSEAMTEIALAEMPWLQVPDTLTATLDQLVSVPVVVKDRVPAMAALALGLPRTTGASVTITPPAGATQKCKGSKLSGAAVNGKVTLKVCATKSGIYSIAGKGAVATTALTLLVTGSAPLPVTSLNAISPSVGKIAVAWNAPTFNGGKAFPVNGYRIELSSGGKVVKTVTFTKPADISKRSYIFTNLASAKTYSVSVRASNKAGQSDSVTTTVGVA